MKTIQLLFMTLVYVLLFITDASCKEATDKLFDFYCGCSFEYININGKKTAVVDEDTCPFVSPTGKPLTIEKEHIVPVSVFGKNFECWHKPLCTDRRGKNYGGRRCCLKIDKGFKRIYYDKENIRLVIGEMNRLRRDYPFGVAIKGENYGCKIYIDKENKTVEASKKIQEEISHIYNYMRLQYE